jgi:hypothetical protein
MQSDRLAQKKTQRVILAWSETDLCDWRKGDWVVPLTAEAHVAASDMAGNDVVDVHSALSKAVTVNAIRVVNDLHERLKTSDYPWLEAYANVIFSIKIFQLLAWSTHLLALQEGFYPLRLQIQRPQAFAQRGLWEDTFIYGLAQRSFALACESLETAGVRFTGAKPVIESRAQRLCRTFLGRSVGRVASKVMRSYPLTSRGKNGESKRVMSSTQESDVILVSQQYTDASHAGPLASHLAKRFGERFLWIGIRPQPAANLTREEMDLTAHLDFEQLRFVDSAPLFSGPAKATTIRSLLLDLGGAWHVGNLLAEDNTLGIGRNQWFEFLMDPDLRGFATRYEVWDRTLAALNPKVVVGLSTLQDMALVRAWARRRAVPFVNFMHGVSAMNSSYHVDADYLGVFGSILADQVKNSDLPHPRSVVACGAMQFADKLTSTRESSSNGNSSPCGNNVLFLGAFEWLPFCPWSPADMWRMLRDIHQVCKEFGKILRVRPHPRYPAAFWAPYVHALNRQHPQTTVLSSESSISRDVGMADFVVASTFDGGVLDAMMIGKVVISYLPEGVEHTDGSRLLEDVGAVAHNIEELKALFAMLVTKSNQTTDLQLQQTRFLQQYIGAPEGDHWAGALNLIEDALHEKRPALQTFS